MCGIYGIIHFDGSSPTIEKLRAGNDLAAHRGPDGEGVYVHHGVGLAHRRLAVIDLSSAGKQPMLYRERLAITFNGEIYNFIELRQELSRLGHAFVSHCDTEVVLAAFDEWGDACFARFDGMWALAIHDRLSQSVWLSRDRFGEKPLHWARTPKGIVFASEIRQLLPVLATVRANAQVLDAYLSHGIEGDLRTTFFEGVHRLPGSHTMRVCTRSGEMTSRPYYRIGSNSNIASLDDAEGARAIREALLQSVKMRLRSDVRVGMCLSGGLDSSSIAALAAPIHREQGSNALTAIHGRSSERTTDESSFARQVASHCGLDLHLMQPETNEFSRLLDEVVNTQEEPFGGPSVVMQYLLMRRARELGCVVMLDGQGGDETLFGNERYFIPLAARHLAAGEFLCAADLLLRARLFKLSRLRLLMKAGLFAFPSALAPIERFTRRYTRPGRQSAAPTSWQTTMGTLDSRAVQIMDLTTHCLPRLLRYEDRNSMRHGVEARLPFLDWKFVELGVSLSDRLKSHDGYLKYGLRIAMEHDLPADVVWREHKHGFEAPVATWLEACRSRMNDEILASRVLQDRFHPSQLSHLDLGSYWRLFNVAAWERVFGVHGTD